MKTYTITQTTGTRSEAAIQLEQQRAERLANIKLTPTYTKVRDAINSNDYAGITAWDLAWSIASRLKPGTKITNTRIQNLTFVIVDLGEIGLIGFDRDTATYSSKN